jgi:hypothetical protein
MKTVTMQAAMATGMAQGEFQGAISNMEAVCGRILAPVFWARLYSWGSARGRGGSFYYVAAMVEGLRLVLAAATDVGAAGPGGAVPGVACMKNSERAHAGGGARHERSI